MSCNIISHACSARSRYYKAHYGCKMAAISDFSARLLTTKFVPIEPIVHHTAQLFTNVSSFSDPLKRKKRKRQVPVRFQTHILWIMRRVLYHCAATIAQLWPNAA